MGELIQTAELTLESIKRYAGFSLDQIYNGLDCCVTMEILEELTRMSNQVPLIYDFERALQAPALDMMLRGFMVDQYERRKCQEALRANLAFVNGRLQRMVGVFTQAQLGDNRKTGNLLNPNSTLQLQKFFYEMLHIPPVYKYEAGTKKMPMDRDALEKIGENYLAGPFVSAILGLREDAKSLKVLETEIDLDGRMRTSYNIASTTTGRWSSSKNAEGTGGNLQNWKERLRKIMVADHGWKLCAIDLEQADAREIGFALGVLFGDWSYLNNCESGDLHTNSSKLIWPELRWPGDRKLDRALAESNFYRDFSYRDMAKRGGHAITYVAQPMTISRHLKIPFKVAALFEQRFFGAYPSIPRLHLWTAGELQSTRRLKTYFGRERHFLGRPNDDATLREAVAFLGQSPTADRMSLGVYRLWDRLRKEIRLIAQLHDAVYFLYRPADEARIIPAALECCQIPIRAPSGRSFTVPGEAKVGWNWSKHHDTGKPLDPKKNQFNPNGLVKWSATKRDERVREHGEVF